MIDHGTELERWVALVIGMAVVIGVTRLLLWQRSALPASRSPRLRLILLLALQPAIGGLLYFSLFPPSVETRSGTIVVATAGAPATIPVSVNEVLIRLPEAGPVEGATQVPDLATALRRYPSTARIRVEGDGLIPRDQISLAIPVDFDAPPLSRGLVDLTMPEPVAPGASFSVGGRIGTLATGTIELVDPANTVVDRVTLTSGQRFVVTGDTRTAGLAVFTLRLRDSAGALIEDIAVPIEALFQPQPDVLVLAGAPSAETKYLSRWAQEAQIDLSLDIDIGGGVRIGDEREPLTRTSLGRADLLIIDDRRWQALDARQRAMIVAAVDEGLGLLLLPTGPIAETTRRSWSDLGLSLTGGQNSRTLRLASRSRSTDLNDDVADALPELSGRDLVHGGPNAIAFLRDASGQPLASWRTRGQGRVGIWTVTDSYALALFGRSDRYGEIWSALFSSLARADGKPRMRVLGFNRVGERAVLCGAAEDMAVTAPDGQKTILLIDASSGDQACAAYWPQQSGWHTAVGPGQETAFYVHPSTSAHALVRTRNRDATLAIRSMPSQAGARQNDQRVPGSPWVFFAGFIASVALLWAIERRVIRPSRQPSEEASSP